MEEWWPGTTEADPSTLERIIAREKKIGLPLRVAPPPACQRLWELAKASGIPVSQLYVLNHPLRSGKLGSRNIRTGEIWILYRGEEHLSETLVTELHELAHAKRNSVVEPTIEAYWNEEEATYQEAYKLAKAWGVPEYFSEEVLQQCLDTVDLFRSIQIGIAACIGTSDANYVRLAYEILLEEVVWPNGWDLEGLQAAVNGWYGAEEQLGKVLEFNRGALRSAWGGATSVGGDLGTLSITEERSARVLYTSLGQVATRALALRREPKKARHFYTLVQTRDDLAQALALANDKLLFEQDRPHRITWTLYGDQISASVPRVYRLAVYDSEEREQLCEVWVLFTLLGAEEAIAEAAWQRYLVSWQRVAAIRVEPLSDGLALLWSFLSQGKAAGG
jgi:hypothetical protein